LVFQGWRAGPFFLVGGVMAGREPKTWEEFYRSRMDAVFRDGVECPGCVFPGLAHWPGCGSQNVFAAPVKKSDDFPPCGGAGG